MDAERWPEGSVAPFAPAYIRRGILWNAAGQTASRALNLLTVLLLARLITPRDFGLVGIGVAVVGFATVLTDIGVASALVQRQRDIRENASAAFYLNALTVFVLAGALLLLSAPIANFYGHPAVHRLIPLLTAAFVIRASMAVHEAFLRKRMLFRRLQLINISSALVNGGTAVFLAWRGAGASSLAWGLLLGGCAYAGFTLIGSGMPLSANPYFHRWRGLLAYGRWVFLGGIAGWALQYGDNLAVGKFLGASDLGMYAIAYSYGLLPFLLIGGAIGQVMFPAFSRLQEGSEQLEALLLKIISISAVVSFPIAGILVYTAGDAFVAVLGPKWIEAGPPFHVLSVMFTVGIFSASFPRVYDAVNRPIINLYIALATLPVFVVCTAIGLRFGIFGVAIGISAMLVIVALLQVFAVSRATSLSIRTIVGGIWPPAFCVAIGSTTGLVPLLLLSSHLPSLAVDAAASVCMLTVYLLTLRRFFPLFWSDALSLGATTPGGT